MIIFIIIYKITIIRILWNVYKAMMYLSIPFSKNNDKVMKYSCDITAYGSI